MSRSLAFALVLASALPAFAGGRTFALTTLVKNGTTPLRSGEQSVTVRADPGAKVSQKLGSTGVLVPVPSHLNAAGTSRLFTASSGKFYVSPDNSTFKIK